MANARKNRNPAPTLCRFIVLFAASLLPLLNGCGTNHTRAIQPATAYEKEELYPSVGKQVDLEGRWNPAGKFGPYIMVGKEPVYLTAQDRPGLVQMKSLSQKFANYSNAVVRFSGTLRHRDSLPSPDRYVSGIPAHYFMELPGVKVSLSR